MANTELVKRVGVVNRNIGDDKVGDEQLFEHVRANIALLDKLPSRPARQTGLPHRWSDEVILNPVEIDSILCAKRANNEYMHVSPVLQTKVCPFFAITLGLHFGNLLYAKRSNFIGKSSARTCCFAAFAPTS